MRTTARIRSCALNLRPTFFVFADSTLIAARVVLQAVTTEAAFSRFLPRLPTLLPPSSMSHSSLPNVLMQSIAHFLATKERLALARCSRQNRILALVPFAWLHADPIAVTVNTGVDGSEHPSCTLLRFIPTHFVWHGPATLARKG